MSARQRLDADPMLRSYVRSFLGPSSPPSPSRLARTLRRLEAQERNARTPHERTRAHLDRRCDEHPTSRPKRLTPQ